ncbi:MAG: hypothetical protein HGA54_04875 [Actinobacteria bacterium]|nr:hypothetical protein [Actinomycetota bacterium]
MNETTEQSRRAFIKNAGSIIAVTATAGLTGFKPGIGLTGLPKPYMQQIYLMDTHIAGTTYIPDIENRLGKLAIGARLKFSRESDNTFDPVAIVVSNEEGERIGFAPKRRTLSWRILWMRGSSSMVRFRGWKNWVVGIR